MSASMSTQNTLVRQMAFSPRFSWTVRAQLAAAIRERDALLELKRQRDSEARRRSEEKSEEHRTKQSHTAPITRRSSRIARMQRIYYKE
tara:strand:+ start:318 stop:584 length:267 start_codon:yes stop_codon:yes gene_type:complete